MDNADYQPRELSSFFNEGASEAPAAVETPAAPAADLASEPAIEAQGQSETIGQPRGPDGKFARKEAGADEAAPADTAVAAPVPDNDTGGSPPPGKAPVPEAALLGERRRRQDAENRARALEAQLAALSRQPQAPPAAETAPPDFWDDPEAALEARFDQFGQTLLDRFEQRQLVNRVNKSEAVARSKYEDFEEVCGEFQRVAATNPALMREMAESDDPAEFAYRKGKSLAELNQYGDIEALLAAKRAEWEAELRGRAPSPSPTLPPSTASERSVGVSRTGPDWAGPKPLSSFFQT